MRLVSLGAAAAVLLLAACSQIDHGNKLETLRFGTNADAITPLRAQDIFECFPQQLVLIGEFTDHSLGNFTARGALYQSSDPSKVQVSNGDIPVPGTTGFFARGVMLPVGLGGPATITGTFGSLTAQIAVTVNPVGEVVVTPAEAWLAPGSLLALKATADFNGRPVDVSSSGEWSIDAPDTSIAGIGALNGLASGGNTPGVVTARYSLPICANSNPPTAHAVSTLHVEQIDHLEVTRQFPGQPVLMSTSPVYQTLEAIDTVAVFAGGQRQDLSAQAQLTLAPPDAGTFLNTGAAPFLLRTVQEGAPVTVSTSFTSAGSTLTAQVAEPLNVKAATLVSVDFAPADQNPVIAPFGSYPFHVIGTFTADGVTFQQDLTRSVGWLSSDPTVAASNITVAPGIDGGNGTATSLTADAICVTITADTGVLSGTDTIKATTTLQVSPGAPATQSPPPRSPCQV